MIQNQDQYQHQIKSYQAQGAYTLSFRMIPFLWRCHLSYIELGDGRILEGKIDHFIELTASVIW